MYSATYIRDVSLKEIIYPISQLLMGPPRGTRNPAFTQFFSQITPRNSLKFMFMPSLPNHAGCRIDHSRNHTTFLIQFLFSCSKIRQITSSRFPLEGPVEVINGSKSVIKMRLGVQKIVKLSTTRPSSQRMNVPVVTRRNNVWGRYSALSVRCTALAIVSF